MKLSKIFKAFVWAASKIKMVVSYIASFVYSIVLMIYLDHLEIREKIDRLNDPGYYFKQRKQR